MNTTICPNQESNAPTHYTETSGTEHNHLWWINDASRIIRNNAWGELEPRHVRHLIEEIRDLQILLNHAWAYDPPDPF